MKKKIIVIVVVFLLAIVVVAVYFATATTDTDTVKMLTPEEGTISLVSEEHILNGNQVFRVALVVRKDGRQVFAVIPPTSGGKEVEEGDKVWLVFVTTPLKVEAIVVPRLRQ